jgi:cobalt-zinc-cadmium efflux system outer membrane protein
MKFWPHFFGIVLLAGCAHFKSQPLAPEKTATQWESRQLDDAGLKKFLEQNLGHELQNWPLTNWDLNSLSLAAFYFQPSLDVARAQWRVAQAGEKTAGGRPNPTLSITPGYDTTTAIPSPWFPAVNFDLPIETAGKRGKRIAEAQQVSESARFDFISAAWKVRGDVRDSLLDLKSSTRRADLLEKQFALQQQILKLLQQRFDLGEISRPDLTAAQIAQTKALLDFRDAKSKAAAARVALAQSVGVSVAALENVQLDFDFAQPSPDVLTSAAARKMALQSRADILGALADYAAAEDDLQLEIAKQYPDVHLNPGYQFDQGDNKWSLGLSFELPVLNQNQGPIAETEALRKLAATKFIALQAQVIGQIDSAIARWLAAMDQSTPGDVLFSAQQAQLKSVQAQMDSGGADTLDFASAQLDLNIGALAKLDGDIESQRALGALEDAVQSPLALSPDAIRAAQNNSSNQSLK